MPVLGEKASTRQRRSMNIHRVVTLIFPLAIIPIEFRVFSARRAVETIVTNRDRLPLLLLMLTPEP